MLDNLELNHPYTVSVILPLPSIKTQVSWGNTDHIEDNLTSVIEKEFRRAFQLQKNQLGVKLGESFQDGSGGIGGSFEIVCNRKKLSYGFFNITSQLNQNIG